MKPTISASCFHELRRTPRPWWHWVLIAVAAFVALMRCREGR